MPVGRASQLATECWRLGRLKNASGIHGGERLALERAARCLNEVLNSIGLRVIDFAGSPLGQIGCVSPEGKKDSKARPNVAALHICP
jgi:hypothetical protein